MDLGFRHGAASMAAIAILAGGTSAAADECTERFVPDRPSLTNTHATVSPGCGLFEGGVLVERISHSETISFPLIFRVGVASWLELRAGTDVVRIARIDADDAPQGPRTPAAEDHTDFAAPSAHLGFKLMAVEAKGRRPGLGMVVDVASQTNASFVDELSVGTFGLFDWEFVESLTFSLNAGIGQRPAPDPASTRRAAFVGAVVLNYELPDPVGWLSLFVDAGGTVELREEAPRLQLVGGGFAFKVADAMQLATQVRGAVTGDPRPITVSADVSVGF
jgi:hypothetical protein